MWLAPFMDGPDGKIAHAELKIGDSVIMLSDEMPGSETRSPQSLGGTTSGVFLYVKDVDAVFQKATTARAKAAAQPADMFWGDRYAKVMDPYGHSWSPGHAQRGRCPREAKETRRSAYEQDGGDA